MKLYLEISGNVSGPLGTGEDVDEFAEEAIDEWLSSNISCKKQKIKFGNYEYLQKDVDKFSCIYSFDFNQSIASQKRETRIWQKLCNW